VRRGGDDVLFQRLLGDVGHRVRGLAVDLERLENVHLEVEGDEQGGDVLVARGVVRALREAGFDVAQGAQQVERRAGAEIEGHGRGCRVPCGGCERLWRVLAHVWRVLAHEVGEGVAAPSPPADAVRRAGGNALVTHLFVKPVTQDSKELYRVA
jgi:hypothetical protein